MQRDFTQLYTATNKTIPHFIAKLSQVSDECNFKELENMLRERLVVGCSGINIQANVNVLEQKKRQNGGVGVGSRAEELVTVL